MQRTNTTNRTRFDLPGPRAVTFTFVSQARWKGALSKMNAEGRKLVREHRCRQAPPGRAIRISIPASSDWSMVSHWHPSQNGQHDDLVLAPPSTCSYVVCVEGHMSAGNIFPCSHRAMSSSAGKSCPFSTGARVSWGKYSAARRQPLTVDLVGNHMWRNVCSATLDRDLFPQLRSTPRWFKIIYDRCLNETLQQKLLDSMLALQLKCIYYAHDFHTNHGTLFSASAFWFLPFSRAPDWARGVDWKCEQITAWICMFAISWFCYLFLGMKGQYAEYCDDLQCVEEELDDDLETEAVDEGQYRPQHGYFPYNGSMWPPRDENMMRSRTRRGVFYGEVEDYNLS